MTSKSIAFSIKNLLYAAFAVIIMILYTAPQFKYLVSYETLFGITIVFYLAFSADKSGINLLVMFFQFALPYCLVMWIVARAGSFKYGFLHPLLLLWILVFPIFITIITLKRNVKWEKIIILVSSLVSLFITLYVTSQEMEVNEIIMRAIASGHDVDLVEEMKGKGVGDYGIAYGAGAILVAGFILFERLKRPFYKYLVLVALVYVMVFVLRAQFATLLIITFISIVYYYFIKSKHVGHRIVLVGVSAAFIFLLPSILQIIIGLYGDSVVAGKFSVMNQSLFGGGEISEVSGGRSESQLDALFLFFKSPIWGNSIVDTHNAAIVGEAHSTILGEAAKTGLIGIISYIYVFLFYIKKLKVSLGTNYYYYNPIALYLMLFAFFNPIGGVREAMWMILLTIPLLYDVLLPSQKQ